MGARERPCQGQGGATGRRAISVPQISPKWCPEPKTAPHRPLSDGGYAGDLPQVRVLSPRPPSHLVRRIYVAGAPIFGSRGFRIFRTVHPKRTLPMGRAKRPQRGSGLLL